MSDLVNFQRITEIITQIDICTDAETSVLDYWQLGIF